MRAHLLKYKYECIRSLAHGHHTSIPTGAGKPSSLIHAGFDNILFTPNGRVHRLITALLLKICSTHSSPLCWAKRIWPQNSRPLRHSDLLYENEAEYGNPKADMQSKTKLGLLHCIIRRRDFQAAPRLHKRAWPRKNDWEPYLPIDPHTIEQKISKSTISATTRSGILKVPIIMLLTMALQALPERTAGTYSTYTN